MDKDNTRPSDLSGPYEGMSIKQIEAELDKEREAERLADLAAKLGHRPEDRDPSKDFTTKAGRKAHHLGDGYMVETGLSHNEFGDVNDLAILDNESMEAVIVDAV